MKTIRLVWANIRSAWSQIPLSVIITAAWPLLLGSLMIIAMRGAASGDVINVPLTIEDHDASAYSEVITETLNEIDFITLKEDEPTDFTLVIPEGFSDSLVSDEVKYPTLKNRATDKQLEETVLVRLIESIGREIRYGASLENELKDQAISLPDSLALAQELQQVALEKADLFAVRENKLDENIGLLSKSLNNIAITQMVYLISMVGISVAAGGKMAEERGLNKRIFASSTDRGVHVLAAYIYNLIFLGIALLIYIGLMKWLHGIFIGSILGYWAVGMLLGMFTIGILTFLSTILKNQEYVSAIAVVFMMVTLMMGTFGSMSEMGDAPESLKIMNQYRIDRVVIDASERVRLGNLDLASLAPNLTLAAIGVFILVVSIVIVRRRKELLR